MYITEKKPEKSKPKKKKNNKSSKTLAEQGGLQKGSTPFEKKNPTAAINCLLRTGNFDLNQNFQKKLSQSKTWKEVL